MIETGRWCREQRKNWGKKCSKISKKVRMRTRLTGSIKNKKKILFRTDFTSIRCLVEWKLWFSLHFLPRASTKHYQKSIERQENVNKTRKKENFHFINNWMEDEMRFYFISRSRGDWNLNFQTLKICEGRIETSFKFHSFEISRKILSAWTRRKVFAFAHVPSTTRGKIAVEWREFLCLASVLNF